MFLPTLLMPTRLPSRPHRNPARVYPMGLKRNKHLAQCFFQATWENGNLAVVDQLTGPDFIADYPVLPAPLDRTAFKAWVADIHTAFPDLSMTTTNVIAENDHVVIAWTARGTHSGPIGFLNLGPTHKAVCFTGIVIYRIVNHRIVEEVGEEDIFGLFKQLGLIN